MRREERREEEMEAGTFIHGVEWGMGRQGICTEEGGIWEGGREREIDHKA
jgi:hypothetical protein